MTKLPGRSCLRKTRLMAACVLLSQRTVAFSPHPRRAKTLRFYASRMRSDPRLEAETLALPTHVTKQLPDRRKRDPQKTSPKAPRAGMSSSMSGVGLLVSLGIVFTLAMSNEPVPLPELASSGGFEILEDSLETAGRNLWRASMPQTASDVVSVALGEGIAGIIGAAATILASLLIRVRTANDKVMNHNDLLRGAVADGDYFVTRAAALPLFESLGLSPLAASITSVILASVPYEIIKLGPSRERARLEEDLLLEQLLKEEQEKARQQEGLISRMMGRKIEPTSSSVDPQSLIPVMDNKPIDFVELFSDITRWLEYDVLKSDLSGRLTWNGQVLTSNVDSAIFGLFAALSSRVYADLIYRYTTLGTQEKQDELRSWSFSELLQLYASTSFKSAVLFGVYETVKSPIGKTIAGFLSGGVDSCIGSEDYKTCLDTYILNNSPQADTAAQIRSLVTSFVSLWDRLESDGSLDKEEVTRSLVVQLYSLLDDIFTFSLYAADAVPSSLY